MPRRIYTEFIFTYGKNNSNSFNLPNKALSFYNICQRLILVVFLVKIFWVRIAGPPGKNMSALLSTESKSEVQTVFSLGHLAADQRQISEEVRNHFHSNRSGI
ncbi:hypothetical protein CHARACLAT_033037 [Characodon lateralis]|uniref:Uncharacterized protein n=1 Tax=Characodon lateralis TaxID=208331 RepID=A0ABU7FB62_9TELE|nr:hypothetical protein [Characodon lateralis]